MYSIKKHGKSDELAFLHFRVRDFLLGVRVDEIEDNRNDDTDESFQKLTEAERLRLVYEILTQPESEGGAGISSQVDKYVDSILPLHNEEFNKVNFIISSYKN